jgi:MarR family transcriptional regulator, negative regulator of the multidrug operon emrRAB
VSSTLAQRRGVAQPGSAPALGAGGPGFKSRRPDRSVENLAGAFATTVGRAIDRAVLDATGLGGTEAAALVALAGFAYGGRQDVLVAALDISQPGVARAVERLAARRLLARRRGAHDARETRLELTAAGRRPITGILLARERVLADALAPLTAAERGRFETALEKLLASMTHDRATARRICRLCDGVACGHPERRP